MSKLIEAWDGETALTTLASQRPDLILMDIQLPGIDGYEVTRRIKADPGLRAIPIIAVTSYALSGDDEKAFKAGCDASSVAGEGPSVLAPGHPDEVIEGLCSRRSPDWVNARNRCAIARCAGRLSREFGHQRRDLR